MEAPYLTRSGSSQIKKKKKKTSKQKSARPAGHHDTIDLSLFPATSSPDCDNDLSSFDELDLSDRECPRRKRHSNDESDEDDSDDVVVKRLYEGPRKCRCCTNWVKDPPKTAITRNKTETKQAVTVRYSTLHTDLGTLTPILSVAVHSQHIKDFLNKALDKYPGISIGRPDAMFYPPFQPLVHVWKDLEASLAVMDDDVARTHVEGFFEVIEPEISETIKDREDLLSRGLITYNLLWTLYRPGARVFIEINGTRHLMKIQSASDEVTRFNIVLEYWDLSLKTPMVRFWSEFVFHFSGNKPVNDLSAIPFEYFPGAEAMRDSLERRGRKITAIPRGSLQYFKGYVAVPVPGFAYTQNKHIEGRIVVDPEEFDKVNTDPYALGAQPVPVIPPDPLTLDGLGVAAPAKTQDVEELTSEQFTMAGSTIRGFSLSTKSWHEFEADSLMDVQWNDLAFDQLVMQPRRKRLIKALVDSNQGRDSGFDDFIKGKGQGLVMLLQGPPGTGKTLTAESIAERIHLPLYSVHSSELAATAYDIEQKLSEILHRAAHWNAVLLIDEADAFLESRDLTHIDRNKRVAVFLRLLEFYSGVLILTTNRPITFDPAFYSRIHISLKFEELDGSSRASVWKNFLRSMPNNVHEADVEMLADAKLNGRQIKNVIKMASLLAHHEGETLCMEHLETMLEAVDEINEPEEADDSSFHSD